MGVKKSYLWELWPCPFWQTSQHSTRHSLMLDPILNLVRPGKPPTIRSKYIMFHYLIKYLFFLSARNTVFFMDHGQLHRTCTLGSPIRDIATLRRRFMPPLYCDTRVSATPPSNIFNTFRDCSAAWQKETEIKLSSWLLRVDKTRTNYFGIHPKLWTNSYK
jgi:hypothetical protein